MNKLIFFLIIPLAISLIPLADATTWRSEAEQHLIRFYGATGTACGNTYLKDGGGYQLYKDTTSGTGECSNISMTFDITNLPPGVDVTDTSLAYTVDSVGNAINCDIMEVTVDPATATAQALWEDTLDGTTYVNNDSTCTTAGSKTEDLGTSADSAIETLIQADDDQFSIAFKFDNMVRDASFHQIQMNTVTPVLTITYTMDVPDPPEQASVSQTGITWDTPEGNGNAPDDVMIEYSADGNTWSLVNHNPVANEAVTLYNGDPEQFYFSDDSEPRFRLSVNSTSGYSEVIQAYNNTIAANQKSHWPLLSTLNDLGFEDNDGTITGTEKYDSTGQYFDGSSYDTIPNESDYDYERTDDFSVCFSAKWTSTGNRILISKLDATSPNSGWEIGQSSGNKVRFALVNNNVASANVLRVETPLSYNDGVLHRFCIAYPGDSVAANVDMWVDNVSITPTVIDNTLSATILNNKSLYLGTRDAGTSSFLGSIGNVMILNNFMTSHQVDEDYQQYVDHLVRPQNVDDLSITSIGLTSAELDWTTPEVYEETLQGYQVNYTTPWGGPATIVLNNTASSATLYDVSGLSAGTDYSFRVQAWSSGGMSYGSGNIANTTTQGSQFVVGELDTTYTPNPLVAPISFERTEINATTTMLNVTYPDTYDLNCNLGYQFARTNQTYTNLPQTTVDANYVESSFSFNDATGDIVTIRCYDTLTNETGSFVLTWSQFPLLDQLDNFRNGTYGTQGLFGVFDLITLCVIILAMFGFNRVNASVGAVLSIVTVGALAYFGIIELPVIILSALALIVLLAVTSHKDGAS